MAVKYDRVMAQAPNQTRFREIRITAPQPRVVSIDSVTPTRTTTASTLPRITPDGSSHVVAADAAPDVVDTQGYRGSDPRTGCECDGPLEGGGAPHVQTLIERCPIGMQTFYVPARLSTDQYECITDAIFVANTVWENNPRIVSEADLRWALLPLPSTGWRV